MLSSKTGSVALLLLVAGCSKISSPSANGLGSASRGSGSPAPLPRWAPSAAPSVAAPSVAAPSASAKVDEPELAWGSRPAKTGVLFPLVDGMCIHGEVLRYDNAQLFAYGMWRGPFSRGGEPTAQWIGEGGLTEQATAGVGFLVSYGGAPIVAGRYPDQLLQITHNSTRMGSASFLVFGGATKESRKTVLDQGGDPKADTPRPVVGAPTRDLNQPLRLRDGSWLVPETLWSVTTKDGSADPHYGFRKLSPEGALVPNAKVPGPDLAHAAARNDGGYGDQYSDGQAPFAELENGEIVALGAAKLLRWSPSKPVDDVGSPAPGPFRKGLQHGDKRVYFSVAGTLQFYDGEKVGSPKLAERIAAGKDVAWYIDKNDSLYAVVPAANGATLWSETPKGDIKEEPLPAMGDLFGLMHGAFWLRVVGKRNASGVGASDTLFRRMGAAWEPVPLPPPLFGTALRGPLVVERVQAFSADDVFVNVRRVEKGWGWKDPEPYRVIYRTKRPNQTMRCQDVRAEQTGVGLWSWPPSAEDTCKTPFVVVSMEREPLPNSYPGIAAQMRGKKEFGESVAFVSFQGRGKINLGIVQESVASARTLATLISKSQDFRADVVCGRPTAMRELRLDTQTGVFSSPTEVKP
jgi:hypothetical protein